MLCTILSVLGTAGLMTVISHADWTSGADTACGASPVVNRACITGASFLGWIETMRNFVIHVVEKMPCAQLQGFATLIILTAAFLVAVTMIARAMLRSSEQRLQGHWLFMILSVLTFVLNVVAFFGSVLLLRGYWAGWSLPACLHFLQNPAWVWPFLILFSTKVREIMVQYVGDVAIYVRPNKVDRFEVVRSEIKEAARIQGKDTLHIRERLASTVQPLIMSYPKFRKFKWINVFSRNDIVSGHLKFYDLPGCQDDPVPPVAAQNIKDRDATVPLVAHVSYCKNKTVWR
jgi:hypothetical protein